MNSWINQLRIVYLEKQTELNSNFTGTAPPGSNGEVHTMTTYIDLYTSVSLMAVSAQLFVIALILHNLKIICKAQHIPSIGEVL